MMPSARQQLDVCEISEKGQRILDAIPEEVKEEQFGRFVAIKVGSGLNTG